MKNFLLILPLSLALGCATAVVRPYVGEQQNWPVLEGSIVNVKYDLPIFNSLPPVPYDIVCELRIESPFYAQPEEQHMPLLVQKARELGAQALVLVDGQMFFGVNYGSRTSGKIETAQLRLTQVNRFLPESFRPGVSVLAIRWLEGAPAGLPAKYASLSKKTYTPPPPSVTAPAESKTTKPTQKPASPKTNVVPAKPASTTPPSATSTNKPTTNIKTAKPAAPDEAR